jgi:uncharacterized membrane protein
MKFVGYVLFVLFLTMCRSYAHDREIFVKYASFLFMAMSHAYMSLSILLAMLVLKSWLSCLSLSQV